MKQIQFAVFFAALLICLSSLPAKADMKLDVLEVTGIFLGIDIKEEPHRLRLQVEENEFSGPLEESCLFWDDELKATSRDDFVRLYLKRVITVTLLEETGSVISCKVGS